MTGPVALVTGGQQGIGLGIATALADSGFAVALAAEAPPGDGAVRAALDRLGASSGYWQHDLSQTGGEAALIDAVEADLGPVTTLVSNAGIPARRRGDMLDLAPDSFDAVMAVNLRGGFFLAQEVARRMLARPSDHYRAMCFVTSVSAAMASVERAEYCLSKAGAAMMVQLFALRLAPLGIGVFDLRPGIIDTAMTASVRDRYDGLIADGLVPARRWGRPDDIGRAILPLVTGAFGFATGSIVALDGGLSIARL